MEQKRLKKLEETIFLIPYSLEEIFEYTTKEIPDTESEFIKVFANFENNEFELHIMLHDIFNDYFKYCKEAIEEKLQEELTEKVFNVNAMMHFYMTYFDTAKDDLSGLLLEFQKFHQNRSINHYQCNNYMEFIFSIISLLNTISTYKANFDLIDEINNIKTIREKKLKDNTFRSLYKDENVNLEMMKDFKFIEMLFMETAKPKFPTYYEITHQEFITLLNTKVCKKSKELEKEAVRLMKDVSTKENVNFYDYLERLLKLSFNYDDIRKKSDDEPTMEDSNKIALFIQKVREVLEKEVHKEKAEKAEKTDNKKDIQK